MDNPIQLSSNPYIDAQTKRNIHNNHDYMSCKKYGLTMNMFKNFEIDPGFLFKYKAQNNDVIFDATKPEYVENSMDPVIDDDEIGTKNLDEVVDAYDEMIEDEFENDDTEVDLSDRTIDPRLKELAQTQQRNRSRSAIPMFKQNKTLENVSDKNPEKTEVSFGTSSSFLAKRKSFHGPVLEKMVRDKDAKIIKLDKTTSLPVFDKNSKSYLTHLFVDLDGDIIKLNWSNAKQKGGQFLQDYNAFRKMMVFGMLKKISNVFKCSRCMIVPTGHNDPESDLDISIYGHQAVSITKTFIKVFRLMWGEDSAVIFDCNLYADSFYEPANTSSYKYICFDKDGDVIEDKIYRIMMTDQYDIYNQHVWGFIKVIMYVTKYVQNLYVLDFNREGICLKLRIIIAMMIAEQYLNYMLCKAFNNDKNVIQNNRLFVSHFKLAIKRFQNIILNLNGQIVDRSDVTDASQSVGYESIAQSRRNKSDTGKIVITRSVSEPVSIPAVSNIERVLSFSKTSRDRDSQRIDILSNMFELCSINLFCKNGIGKNVGLNELSHLNDVESVLMISDNIFADRLLNLNSTDLKYYIKLCIEMGRLFSGDLTSDSESLEQFMDQVTKNSPSIINKLKEHEFDSSLDHHILKSTLNIDNIQQMNIKYSEFLNILNIKKNLFTKIPETTGEFDCPVNREIQQFDQTHTWIVQRSAELKDLMSLCNCHAAETYLTQGAFFLIVAIMGKKQNIGISFDEIMDCTMENIGDTIKECSSYIIRQKKDHFKSLNMKGDIKTLQTIYITDRLLIKTSKYLMRMYSSQRRSYDMIRDKMSRYNNLSSIENKGLVEIKQRSDNLNILIGKTETIRSGLRGKSEDLVNQFSKANVSSVYAKTLRGLIKDTVIQMRDVRGVQVPSLRISSQTRQNIEKMNPYLAKQRDLDLDVDDIVLEINKYLADNIYDTIFPEKQEVNVEGVFKYCIEFFFKNIPMFYRKDPDSSNTHVIRFLHNVWFDMDKYTEDINTITSREPLLPDFRSLCSSLAS